MVASLAAPTAAAGSEQSATFRGSRGQYRIVGTLSSAAGPAVVFRGHGIESGQTVAIKLPAAVAPDAMDALRQEIAILRRLDHPGIVRIVDHGERDGLPWCATELVPGGTLRELWDAPEALERGGAGRRPWLVLFQKLCMALAYMHEQGVVHRDLKPANVAVRDQQWEPVVLDLGAGGRWNAREGRETIEAGGALVGTPEYLAPEQASGEYVDARADLYSLGCMMYQAVVGAPPFTGSAAEVITCHLSEVPPPPSSRCAGVDGALEQLILRLLEKRPAQRIGFAADVAKALSEMTGIPIDDNAFSEYLYRPSFVGRADARRKVMALLGGARDRRGACALVGGESGAGKTRFAKEMTREAVGFGFAVITGECTPFEGQAAGSQLSRQPLAPLRPLLRAVRDACAAGGAEVTAKLLGESAKVLAAYEPAIRSVPGYEAQPDPVPLSPLAERERALGDLAEVTVRLACENPVLLVIDDLQWADDMTLAFLLAFRSQVSSRAAASLLGCYRAEEAVGVIPSLLAEKHVENIALDRLGGREVDTMVSDMLAIAAPPRPLLDTLHRVSEGNPFFVSEYLRVSMETGMLSRSSQGLWEVTASADYDAIPLPAAIRNLVDRRLSGLGSAAAALLAVGAVLGREFSLDDACAVLRIEWDAATPAIAELFKRQILEQLHAERVSFAHDKLREGAYARLSKSDARRIHRAAAEGLESRTRPGETVSERLVELGHHWEQAGVLDRAAAYLGEAAGIALASGAYNDASHMVDRALRLDDESGGLAERLTRAQWERMLGVAKFAVGELNDSIVHTSKALSRLGQTVPTTSLGWLALTGRELMRVVRPRSQRPDRADRDLLIEVSQACGQIAISHFYNADGLPTVANLLRALDRAERAHDRARVADASCRLGYVLGTVSMRGLAERLFTKARSAVDATASPLTHGTVLYMEAMYREIRAEWPQCRSLGLEAAAVLHHAGDQTEAETAQAIVSHGYFFAGRFEESLELSLAILDGAEGRGNRHHVAWGLYLAARCEVALGRIDEPIERMLRAQEFLGALPDAIDILICDGWLARAFLARGDLARASEFADRIGDLVGKGRRPAVAQCADGFAAWAEVALARLRANPTSHTKAMARQALAELTRFSRSFPMARPASSRCRGDAAWLAGRPRRARRHWSNAIDLARRYEMPYEEARSLASVAGAETGDARPT
jgi:tetratricopeptide (TPR) repeat protein